MQCSPDGFRPPTPPSRIHGDSGNSSMRASYRLWCNVDHTGGCFPAPSKSTAEECQAKCAASSVCVGATWVIASADCYEMAEVGAGTVESGYSSWSKIPVGTAAVGVSSLSLPRFTTDIAAIIVPAVGRW